MFGREGHTPEVQCRGEEDEEGHGLQRNQRHIAVNRSTRGLLNVGQILEHITNHEQTHHFELFSNGDGEGFGNGSDEFVHFVGEDDGKRRVEGVQIGIDEPVHLGDIKR